MYHFILPVAWVTLGGCRPMSEAEHKLDFITARDSQAVGSSTTSSSTITIQTVTLAKEINTTLALLIVLLTMGSYGLLMRYTPTLSNEIILPSKFLEDNIAAVLSLTWPKRYTDSSNGIVIGYPYDWLLFYKKGAVRSIHGIGPVPSHQILGFDDFNEEPIIHERGKSYMVTVKTFSPVMKSLVQIAIWNYVSLWLVLIMIVNTLTYNGFLSHGITNDGVIRLVLVGVYAVASIGHQYHTTTLLYRNFTSVLFQTCWTFICKEFVFGDYMAMRSRMTAGGISRDPDQFDSSDKIWTSFNSELFGIMEHLDTYYVDEIEPRGLLDTDNVVAELLANDVERAPHLRAPHLVARHKTESNYAKFVKPIREAEIKAYEKATDSALEKALANIAVLLGICLATALAPWSSIQTISATSAQLGSYALLLSISAGILALFSSITQLTNATESARILLRLQEKTIEAYHSHDEGVNVSNNFSLGDEPDFSLSKDIKGKSQLTFFSFWRSMSLLDKVRCLLLGPALMLFPRKQGDRLSPPDHGFNYLSLKVQGVQFACETVGPMLGRISRLPLSSDVETGQQREKKHVNAKRERENMNENDNLVEHRQENPGTSGL